MAVKNGSNIWLMLAGSLVNALVDKSFETAIDEIEVTTQDSGGSKEYLAGEDSHNCSFSFLDDESDAYAYDEVWDAAMAKAAVAFIYGAGVKTAGQRIISGNVIITSVNKTDTKNSASAVSGTLRITGTPTKATSTTTVA